MRLRGINAVLWALLIVALIGQTGCGDDPVAPRGTVKIAVTPAPNSGIVSWTLTGPNSYRKTGSSDTTLDEMIAGEYILTWGDVEGWITPVSAPEVLPEGGSVTFIGAYIGFVLVSPGAFSMGSPVSEIGRVETMETLHPVTLTRSFYMATCEVSHKWWADVMDDGTIASQIPKYDVDWVSAAKFCNALSIQEGLTLAYTINGPEVTWNQDADGYRLPTEAEWEFACRSGNSTAFSNGPISDTDCDDPVLDEAGWYCGNSSEDRRRITNGLPTHIVGQLAPNDWGFYDMHGSLWEWVWDSMRTDYQELPQHDPAFDLGAMSWRVVRGGAWQGVAHLCRSAARNSWLPDDNGPGFRPVRTVF